MSLNLCFSHFHVFLNLIICSFTSSADEEDEIILNVESHYAQAKVGNFVLDIGDCVFVKVNFIHCSCLVILSQGYGSFLHDFSFVTHLHCFE